MSGLNRRRLLAATAAFVTTAVSPALAQATTFRTVAVDVRPLRAKGLGDHADAVGAALQRELAAAFVDRIAAGGPKLVVRIDAISMRDYVGGDNRLFGSGSPNDYLEGEALIIGSRGEVLRRHPQLSAVPASSGGAWYSHGSEERRLGALAQHYAGWLRRAL